MAAFSGKNRSGGGKSKNFRSRKSRHLCGPEKELQLQFAVLHTLPPAFILAESLEEKTGQIVPACHFDPLSRGKEDPVRPLVAGAGHAPSCHLFAIL